MEVDFYYELKFLFGEISLVIIDTSVAGEMFCET
ncbi:hypothetical protein VCSRO97_1984 [Vibrio cholerae]|nr:hypothetical protein VCSRO97_1984 [Vibrio cholerae]